MFGETTMLAAKLAIKDIEIMGLDQDPTVHFLTERKVFESMANKAKMCIDTDTNSLAFALCVGALETSGHPVPDSVAQLHFLSRRDMWTALAECVYE